MRREVARFEYPDWYRLAEKVTLHFVAPEPALQLRRLVSHDTLCDHLEVGSDSERGLPGKPNDVLPGALVHGRRKQPPGRTELPFQV